MVQDLSRVQSNSSNALNSVECLELFKPLQFIIIPLNLFIFNDLLCFSVFTWFNAFAAELFKELVLEIGDV